MKLPIVVAATREARASQAIAFLRVIVGAFFLYQGYSKLRDPLFAMRLTSLLSGAADNNPFFFYQDLLRGVIIPNADAFAQIILWSELLIGGSYVVGALMRVSTVGQLFLNLNYLLALQHTHPGERSLNLCFLLLGMTLLFGEAGRQYGLDNWLFRPPVVKKSRSGKATSRSPSALENARKSLASLAIRKPEGGKRGRKRARDEDETVELPEFQEKPRAKSGGKRP